jgi:hypothetical protein
MSAEDVANAFVAHYYQLADTNVDGLGNLFVRFGVLDLLIVRQLLAFPLTHVIFLRLRTLANSIPIRARLHAPTPRQTCKMLSVCIMLSM